MHKAPGHERASCAASVCPGPTGRKAAPPRGRSKHGTWEATVEDTGTTERLSVEGGLEPISMLILLFLLCTVDWKGMMGTGF